MEDYQKVTRYQISVGLDDSESRRQEHPTQVFERIIRNVCKGYQVAYTLIRCTGGYVHDDSTFVTENSFQLTLLGAQEEQVAAIAEDLCAFFHQESVLVTRETTECCFVRSSLGL